MSHQTHVFHLQCPKIRFTFALPEIQVCFRRSDSDTHCHQFSIPNPNRLNTLKLWLRWSVRQIHMTQSRWIWGNVACVVLTGMYRRLNCRKNEKGGGASPHYSSRRPGSFIRSGRPYHDCCKTYECLVMMGLSGNLNLGYSSPLLNVTLASKLLFRIWALLVRSSTWTRAWVVDKNWWKNHIQILWNLVEIWYRSRTCSGLLVCLTTHNVFRYRVVIFVFGLFFWNVRSGCDVLFWPKTWKTWKRILSLDFTNNID